MVKTNQEIKTSQKSGAERAVYLFFGIVSFAVALILGSKKLLFETAPMGIAFICASGKYTGFALAGSLTAALGQKNPVYIFGYLFAALIRVAFSFLLSRNLKAGKLRMQGKLSERIFGKYAVGTVYDSAPSGFYAVLFRENPEARALAAFLSSFSTGIVAMAVGGFQVYDLFGMFFISIAAPVLTVVFMYCTDTLLGRTEFKPIKHSQPETVLPILSVRYAVGTAILVSAITFSLSDRYISVFSCAPLAAAFFTLIVCRRRGVLPGVGMAVAVGLVCDTFSAPMFVICALLFSMIIKLSVPAAFGASLAGAAGWCFYAGGLNGFVTVFPSVALTVPVYYAVERILNFEEKRNGIFTVSSAESDFAIAVLSENALNVTKNKMTALSEAFSSLSSRFFDLSDRFRRPRVLDLRRICDDACSRHCADCRSREICWGAGYCDTLDMITKLAGQLHTKGHADPLLLPREIRIRCLHIEEIAEDVNRKCAELTAELLKNDKTCIFAENYSSISSILDEAISEADSENECDRDAASAVFDYLTSKGAEIFGAVVCGKRAKHIIVRGIGFSKISATPKELCRDIGEMCRAKLGEPTFEVGNDCTVMTLTSSPTLSVKVASGSLSAKAAKVPVGAYIGNGDNGGFPEDPDSCESEYVCGDTTDSFSNRNLFFYSLISDGMGTGRDAMFTSKICSVFLEKMLAAGNKTDVSLRMLNSFIRSENSCTGAECTATVDLMELDLLNGNASFAKSGAAPTYILRGGSVFILRSRTLPIGIIKTPDVCVSKSEIKPDDVVVMVSDGVTQNNDECPWLISLLSESGECEAEALKDKILKRAAQAGCNDDISAVVVRVAAAG